MTLPKRVLIVEDEANVRRVMQLALESSGHTVSTAADGPAGLERFGNGAAVDVVILDQRMPGMEGLEVLRQIKKRTTSVMTGADEEGTEVVVRIEPAAVERLKQFTGSRHQPGGSFWASRAEELLGAILWTEGRLPPPGSLAVKDFSRLELDSALAWPADVP